MEDSAFENGRQVARPEHKQRRPRPTNEDSNFVQNYFASSRLHFIGSFRARFESMMGEVARRLNVHPSVLLTPPPPRAGSAAGERVIVHIDMDCFFASVAVAANPALAGKPIAVCHARVSSDGARTAGSGEISSCSYEARAHGVRAGTFFHEGQKLCPDLIGVPYDFEAYQRVSIAIYARFFGIPGAIVEACSVDEAYLDITDVPDVNPEELVAELRAKIFADNSCRASAGIGPSRLLARLATKRAKPNGQVRVRPSQAPEFVAALRLKDLPGLGWRTGRRLQELGIDSCAALISTPLARLQAEFGEKQGRGFFDAVRGVDDRPVQPMKPRKSIGAEASWGVRFNASVEDHAKCVKFINDMAAEVASRVTEAGALGTKVMYKAYRMKPNAGRAHKYYGHGPCNIFTRSAQLVGKVTSDNLATLLAEQCQRIHAELKIPNNEFRGVGIQVTDISFESLNVDGKHSVGAGNAGRMDAFLKPVPERSAFGHTLLKRKFVEFEELPVQEKSTGKGKKRSRIESFLRRSSEQGESPITSRKRKLMEYDVRHADRIRVTQAQYSKKKPENTDVEDNAPASQAAEEDPVLSDDPKDEPESVGDEILPGPVQSKSSSQAEALTIPGDWDPAVFSALPAEIRDELLASHLQSRDSQPSNRGEASFTNATRSKLDQVESHGASSRPPSKVKPAAGKRGGKTRRGNARKRGGVQVTMTQFAQIAKLKSHGHAILNASQFEEKGLSECIEIAADLEDGKNRKRNGLSVAPAAKKPVSSVTDKAILASHALSSDSDGDADVSQDIATVVAEAGSSGKRIFSEDSVAEIASDLQTWMAHVGSNIRSAHAELLRSRLFELLRLHMLTRVCSEVRTMQVFAEDLKETKWPAVLTKLVAAIQQECTRLHGFTLELAGL